MREFLKTIRQRDQRAPGPFIVREILGACGCGLVATHEVTSKNRAVMFRGCRQHAKDAAERLNRQEGVETTP